MEKKTRKPTQKRALEKYDKIIDAAFKLFNEKGYYNITTADIAKEAEVATGSVYSYFEDKKDIYIQVLQKVSDSFCEPTREFWERNCKIDFDDIESMKKVFREFVKLMLSYHNFSKIFHDDMTALKLLDKDIAEIEKENEIDRIKYTKNILNIISIPFKNEDDSDVLIHYSNLLIDDVCHKILYDDNVKNINLYIEHAVDMLCYLVKKITTK